MDGNEGKEKEQTGCHDQLNEDFIIEISHYQNHESNL